jgi:hypothetical protein
MDAATRCRQPLRVRLRVAACKQVLQYVVFLALPPLLAVAGGLQQHEPLFAFGSGSFVVVALPLPLLLLSADVVELLQQLLLDGGATLLAQARQVVQVPLAAHHQPVGGGDGDGSDSVALRMTKRTHLGKQCDLMLSTITGAAIVLNTNT